LKEIATKKITCITSQNMNGGDWLALGKVAVKRGVDTFNKGIVAKMNIDLPTLKKTRIISELSGIPLQEELVQKMTPEIAAVALAYAIQNNDGDYIDLRGSWLGDINHGPPALANCTMQDHALVQTKSIKAGEQLLFDYGVDYWIFNMTHTDFSSWTDENDISIWEEMHERVVDYSELLSFKLFQMTSRHDMIARVQFYLSHSTPNRASLIYRRRMFA
jgi:hypothetical protein